MPNRIRGGTYTVYELSKEEKTYLRQIVINTRNKYFRKNKYIFIENNIEAADEKFLISIEMSKLILKSKVKGTFVPLT